MLCKKTVRKKIIEAARERFFHYGYGKTTMAEIASDCGMSPGNLYRYFPSKLDIAEEIADAFNDEMLARIRSQARADMSSGERLRAHFFSALRLTYQKLEKDARVVEMAQILSRERPTFSNRELAKERKVLCEILEEGNRAGEFDVRDPMFTAEMMQSATMKYRYPQLWSRLKLDALERELDGVMTLIERGLSAGGALVKQADTASSAQGKSVSTTGARIVS